jgi:hypothetical protein
LRLNPRRLSKEVMQKPVIATLVIGADYKRGLQKCLNSKKSYAETHGYEFIQGGEQFWDRNKPIAWSKIPFMVYLCEKYPVGTLIWLSDADVLITNSELKVEDQIMPLLPEDKDMLLTLDACGHINSGNTFFRNTEWSRDYWKRVGEQTRFTYHIWWENAAMIALYEENPDDKKMIEITREHKKFNAYLRGLPGEPLWEQGDFLVHFAGVYNPAEMDNLTDKILNGETPRLTM